jgi:hypothetical protein
MVKFIRIDQISQFSAHILIEVIRIGNYSFRNCKLINCVIIILVCY